jgi:hypothetical protein
MTTPDEAPVQVQAGLTETPLGQRLAVIITALLPKDQALHLAKGIEQAAGQMSSTRLIVANGNTPPPIAPRDALG